MFIIYPNKAEEMDSDLRKKKFEPYLSLLSAAGAKLVIQVGDDPRWGLDYYRDDIHPTAEGNRVLAKITAETITHHR